MTELCTDCPHLAEGHVVVYGRTVAVIICSEKECPCELPPPAGFIAASPEFVTVVRQTVQRGVHLL